MPTPKANLTERLDEAIDARRYRDGADEPEGVALTEESEQEEQAKLEWLRAAAKEGFDAIDRGDYTSLSSAEEIRQFLRTIHEEVAAEIAAERKSA
jgi:antitoxin ParD1/3/4